MSLTNSYINFVNVDESNISEVHGLSKRCNVDLGFNICKVGTRDGCFTKCVEQTGHPNIGGKCLYDQDGSTFCRCTFFCPSKPISIH